MTLSQRPPPTHDGRVAGWSVGRVVHFSPGDFIVDGVSHFGFRDRTGRLFAIDHPGHACASLDPHGRVTWTLAAKPVFADVPNITAALAYPMYADRLADGRIVVSNFGDARLWAIDERTLTAEVLIEGGDLGLVDMGNCVVGRDDTIWVNEVTGCRVWHFGGDGVPLEVIGDGQPGFQRTAVDFAGARFHWIYDLRRGPDDRIYILDSRNFALRAIDPAARQVVTIAGTGEPGYDGDGGDAHRATFGGDPGARFDGPISLALDEDGNAFIGDRYNHVVRMVERASGLVSTIAGRRAAGDDQANDASERDPLQLNLPQISSMDYAAARLYIPTDLSGERGDLVVLRRAA
jgi:sugar lactone lactonase YvrE